MAFGYVDEERCRSVALECARQIELYAPRFLDARGFAKGFVEGDLSVRVARFRAMDHDHRFRVQTLICKQPGIAVTVGKGGAWRFYPQHLAPRGSFNYGQQRAAALMRALDRT